MILQRQVLQLQEHMAHQLPLLQPKRDKLAGLSRRVKRRKLALKEEAEMGETGAIKAAIRNAKRQGRPNKIGLPDAPRDARKSKAKEERSKNKERVSKIGFEKELGVKRKSAVGGREATRAKEGDAIGSGKKKGR
jgi:ATP-dependent RNA helicase DDX27